MIQFDPASFKDPAGRVFSAGPWVYRTLTEEARRIFESTSASGLIQALAGDELLVDTELMTASAAQLDPSDVTGFVLRQPRLPLVTYSYEWSFEMLRDAALVTLRVLDRLLARGFTLKDATAFNILFDGTVPKLIDVLSIEPYREGQVWTGYGQFCRSFLFPLLLASYRDLDVQSLLRGTLGELPVQQAARLIGIRDYLRPGVLKDIVLQAKLEASFGRSTGRVRTVASDVVYPKAQMVANVRRLLAMVESLSPPRSQSEWSAYGSFHNYDDTDHQRKLEFVGRVVRARSPGRVVDLGCNTGEYSDIAHTMGAHVIALDLDARAIDALYRANAANKRLSPIVASLLNPTPAMGWRLEERRPLPERITSDMFLALALVHHLRITGGVPLAAVVEYLFSLANEGIVEWVDKKDSQVTQMLNLRADVYDDYDWPTFEAVVASVGSIVETCETHGGARRLCHVRADETRRPGTSTAPGTSETVRAS